MSNKLRNLIFLLFLLSWSYRIIKIFTIIQTGVLTDLVNYYHASHSILAGQPNLPRILQSTMGPPFVLLPYLPLALIPFKSAEYLITIINISSYFLVHYLLWKRYYEQTTCFFWFYLSLLAFSFPVTYSLGMGNPVGLIMFGIYALVVFKNKWLQWLSLSLSSVLKLFPLILLIPLIKPDKLKTKNIFIAAIIAILIAVSSYLILPKSAWINYFNTNKIINQPSIPDTQIYNQSFLSSMARIGIIIHPYSLLHLIYLAIITVLLLYFLYKNYYKKTHIDLLDLSIILIAYVLLIHPFPWQYYFAVFLPFLMIKFKQKQWLYLPIFLLISFNGLWLHTNNLLYIFFSNSQFLGILLLYLITLINPPIAEINTND